jgi:hypothetical protein
MRRFMIHFFSVVVLQEAPERQRQGSLCCRAHTCVLADPVVAVCLRLCDA